MSTGFWQDKQVIVTGGAGLLGSQLVPLLLSAGARVLVLDDLSRGAFFDMRAEIKRVDAGEIRALTGYFKEAYAVFNLAAHVAGVIYNQKNHAEMYERNARLQTAPVIAALRMNVQRFIQVSSVCVYAPEHQSPCKEEYGQIGEPHEANNGYAWAKRVGERVTEWAHLPHAVIVRPANMYGPRDYFDQRAHVIPALIKKTLHEDTVKLHGSGDEVREFLYVQDAAKGILHLAEYGRHGEAYNLGTNGDSQTCVSMRRLAELIQVACGVEKPIVTTGGNAGDPLRWTDCRKVQATGWQHSTSLAEGLKQTVEWYKGTI